MKKQITIEDKCHYCNKPLLDKDGKQNAQIIVKSNGFSHRNCATQFKPSSEVKILFYINCWSIGDNIATTPSIRELARLYPNA